MSRNAKQTLSGGKSRALLTGTGPLSGTGPLYRRIQADMRVRITTGNWAANQVLPNRIQLCQEFHTTRITLDKAIQGLVTEGLLRSVKGVGTFVSGQSDEMATRGLAAPPAPTLSPAHITPRTLRMGIVVERNFVPPTDAMTFSDNAYFGPLFQGIRVAVSGKPIDTVFSHLHRSEYVGFFRDAALDGMILITPSLLELPMLRQLVKDGTTYMAVGISSTDPVDAYIPCQDADNRQGTHDAIQHLLDLGHRQIAIINLATAVANHHDRMESYRQVLAEAGLTARPEYILQMNRCDFNQFESHIEQWLMQARDSGTLPTAIFACDYTMTLATLRVLRQHGLRIPEDISVVGFDDPLSAEHLTPPLTTVRQPVYELGRRAAERLLAAMQSGVNPHGSEMLATELIVRKSTCPPRTSSFAPIISSNERKD